MKLPEPRIKGEVSLETTIRNRRTIRSFTSERLTSKQFSQYRISPMLKLNPGLLKVITIKHLKRAGHIYNCRHRNYLLLFTLILYIRHFCVIDYGSRSE